MTNEQLYSKLLEKEKEAEKMKEPPQKKIKKKSPKVSPRADHEKIKATEKGVWEHSGVTSSIEPLIQQIAQKKIDEWSSPATKRSMKDSSVPQPSHITTVKVMNSTK